MEITSAPHDEMHGITEQTVSVPSTSLTIHILFSVLQMCAFSV